MSDAVEDIIQQNVSELRKNAFGDDADDAKSLPWAREQAWMIVDMLSKKPEVRISDSFIKSYSRRLDFVS